MQDFRFLVVDFIFLNSTAGNDELSYNRNQIDLSTGI